jgi:hypothetical protein
MNSVPQEIAGTNFTKPNEYGARFFTFSPANQNSDGKYQFNVIILISKIIANKNFKK